MPDYEFFILKDNKDIIEYEKGLYKAFTKITLSEWREKNYKLIDGNRYKCNIEYEDQVLYAIKEDNKVVLALSVQVNFKDKMLIEKLGFKLREEDKTKKICEGLDFFSFIKMGIKSFEIYLNFFNFVLKDIREKGFKVIYGSCEEKLSLFYKEAGFNFIDSKDINGKKELLLRIKLD